MTTLRYNPQTRQAERLLRSDGVDPDEWIPLERGHGAHALLALYDDALADAKMQLDVAASRYAEFEAAAERTADAMRKARGEKW